MLKNVIFFIQILLCISIHDCREYRFDYKYHREIDGWLKVHRVPAVWSEARLRCELEGAVLASPSNAHLSAILRDIVSRNFPCGIFTGVHATFSKGDYFSVEGIPITRMSLEWAAGEPDNFENSEECLLLTNNGTMADVKCSEVYPYVCYKKKTGPIVLNECGTVDKAYKLEARTGSCYKLHFVGRPWSRAFMTCAAEGAYLAIINSETEAQLLKDIFESHPDPTITGDIMNIASVGFHDWGEQRVWTTIHGQSIHEAGYPYFSQGQPDNAPNGEHCGSMFRNGRLNDIWCDRNTPFICEKEPDSLLVNDYDY